jgi:hypothetical protein
MQNEAVPKIPDLLNKLTAQALETREKLKKRAQQVSQLATIVEEVGKQERNWLAKLASTVKIVHLPFWADALAQPEADAVLVNNALIIRLPKRCRASLNDEELRIALTELGHPDLRFSGSLCPRPQGRP